MGQTEGVSQFMNARFEEILEIEALGQTFIGPNLARDRIVVEYGPASVHRIPCAAPVREPGGAVAEVHENPPDNILPFELVLADSSIHDVIDTIRLVVFTAARGFVAFDAEQFNAAVRLAMEQRFDSRRIARAVHLRKEKAVSGICDLCQSVPSAARDFAVGGREEDDSDGGLFQRRLERQKKEGMRKGRTTAGSLDLTVLYSRVL